GAGERGEDQVLARAVAKKARFGPRGGCDPCDGFVLHLVLLKTLTASERSVARDRRERARARRERPRWGRAPSRRRGVVRCAERSSACRWGSGFRGGRLVRPRP